VALTGYSVGAQMHKVAKPEQVVRAVGVYEWTGDMAKPTASRLIPVSVFIEGKLEDAGVYIARPVPFALLSGNVYELQAAGIDRGLLDLAYARHIQTADGAFDDGWFGYGSVKPLAASKKPAALRASKTLPVLTSSKTDSTHPQLQAKPSGDTTSSGTDQSKPASSAGSGTTSASTDGSDRPTMKRRPSGSTGDSTGAADTTASNSPAPDAGAAKGTGSTSSDDPDRPTMKRRSSGDTGNTTPDSTTSATPDTASSKGSGTAPASDPDRPTMKRRDGSEDTTTASSGGTTSGSTTTGSTTDGSAKGTGSTPADDPDRPTMKRRSSDTSDTSTGSTASTTGTGNTPADDPDRPTLKRHTAEDAKKAKSGQNDVAMTTGVGSLNDDPNRPNLHRGKPVGAMTETDLPKLVGLPPDLHQMVAVSDAANRDPHEFAREWEDAAERATVLQKLQGMARTQLAAYAGASSPAPTAKAAAPTVKKTSATKSKRAISTPAPPEPLLDEELKAYTLSYGGAATYVYMAHTAGTGAALRYVTVVAQADGLGELKPAIQSVTDAAHLDRTPRMKFVDVVDAEASNRASLLFELRGQTARQFGLYRVIASRSEQVFLTGTTQ
jgi:hypothetical protein